MDIAGRIRKKAGDPNLVIPAPNLERPNQWQRMVCPFCTGRQTKKKNGSINYGLDRYRCFRCDAIVPSANGRTFDYEMPYNVLDVLYDEASELYDRFGAVMTRTVGYVAKRFGDWTKPVKGGAPAIEMKELWTEARRLLWEYYQGEIGAPQDSGMMAVWEDQADEDVKRLSSYVGQALKGDLMDYADSMARNIRQGGLKFDRGVKAPDFKDEDGEWVNFVVPSDPMPSSSEDGALTESRLDRALDYEPPNERQKIDPTYKPKPKTVGSNGERIVANDGGCPDWLYWPLAENDNTKFTSWGLRGCELMRNGLGPVKEHCPWCDAQLQHKRLPDLASWLKARGGSSYWWSDQWPQPLADAQRWCRVAEPSLSHQLETIQAT